MAKVTISIPDELLARIDGLAASAGTTRSGLMQEAAGEYLTKLAESDRAAAWRDEVQRAIDGFGALRAQAGPAPESGLDALRAIRELPQDERGAKRSAVRKGAK